LKERRKRLIKPYIISGVAIGTLVVLAFWGPQLVLSGQDMYQMDRIWQGTRNGLDMGKIYSEYGDLRERLEVFSERLEKDYPFYVAGTDYRVDEQFFDILDMVIRQTGYDMLLYAGIAPNLSEVENRGYTVNAWKKYVIYNDIQEGETTGILVSAWYIEFTMRDNMKVKLLVDTESYELYCMQLMGHPDEKIGKDAKINMGRSSVKEQEKYLVSWIFEQGMAETEWMGFWFDYYEAGETLVQSYTDYIENAVKNGVEFKHDYETVNYDIHKMSVLLPYLEYLLKWEMGISFSRVETLPDILFIGLTEIADLIPEFQRD